MTKEKKKKPSVKEMLLLLDVVDEVNHNKEVFRTGKGARKENLCRFYLC